MSGTPISDLAAAGAQECQAALERDLLLGGAAPNAALQTACQILVQARAFAKHLDWNMKADRGEVAKRKGILDKAIKRLSTLGSLSWGPESALLLQGAPASKDGLRPLERIPVALGVLQQASDDLQKVQNLLGPRRGNFRTARYLRDVLLLWVEATGSLPALTVDPHDNHAESPPLRHWLSAVRLFAADDRFDRLAQESETGFRAARDKVVAELQDRQHAVDK